MICLKCNFENTQKLSVVFESGISKINTESTSFGVGVFGEKGGGGLSKTHTKGVSQSIQAQKSEPPKQKKKIFYILMGIFVSMTITYFTVPSVIIGTVILLIAYFQIREINRYNSETYPLLYESWSKSWLCHKCGEIYEQA